jgi:hypothetical protein
MKLPFIEKPKENESTSLTILILSVILVVVAFILNVSGVVEHTSISLEFFGIAGTLYFGRNLGIGARTSTINAPVNESETK